MNLPADHLVLALPDGDFPMDEELRDQCYRLWEMSKFTVLPNPLDVLYYPAGYVNEMFRYHHAIRFYDDIPKRPKDLEE